ncbi:MAG: DNA methyltransferase [Acidimicrobiales bacterium]
MEWGDPIDLPVTDDTAALVMVHVPLFRDPGRHHQPNVAEYVAWLIEVIDEAERILEVGGRLVLIVKAQESRRPFLDLATLLIRPLTKAGMTVPITYTWCTSLVTPAPLDGQPDGLVMTAADPVIPVSSWRVLVASKGHDHRTGSILERQHLGLPHRSTIPTQAWDTASSDVWLIPAPTYPTQGDLPDTLVELILSLYTFVGDLVVNPLAGTATVARIATRMRRRARCFEPDHQILDRINRPTPTPTGGTRTGEGDGEGGLWRR